MAERDNTSNHDQTDSTNSIANADRELDIDKIMNESDIPTEIDSFQQSMMDESIQNAVKNLAGQPKQQQIEPLEVFNDMMREMKTKKSTQKPDAKAMLEKLFPKDEGKDPFDEVSTKHTNLLVLSICST